MRIHMCMCGRAFVGFPWLFVLLASVSHAMQGRSSTSPAASVESLINVKKLRFIVFCKLTDIPLEELFSYVSFQWG